MLLENRYRLEPATDLIGQGGFAKVYKAQDTKFDMPVAIKHFSGTKGNAGSVTREIKKCIHFNHPNIIRYFDCFETRHTNSLGETITEEYGVMEYANAGSLSDLMSGKRSISADQFKELILGILDGLAYLHSRNPVIIHRDLKPSNILLHEENGQLTPKICDFGISKELQGTLAQTTTAAIGTIDYMAPEQIEGKAPSPATDLWALGCIIYEYFNGQPPFGRVTQGASAQQVYWKVINGKLDEAGMKKVPESFRGLVTGCLVVDVGKRVSNAADLKAILLGKTKVQKPISPNEPKSFGAKWFAPIMAISFFIFIISFYFNQEKFLPRSSSSLEVSPPEVTSESTSASTTSESLQSENSRALDQVQADGQKENSSKAISSLPAPIQKLINDMAPIPGGTFWMGCSPGDDECLDNESPRHQVSLSSFSIGRYEVTQAQWRAVMGNHPSYFSGCDICPVENVSWNDIQEFLKKVNTLTGKNFRLPTEAEWEFAARGGSTGSPNLYAGSNNLGSVAWYNDNSKEKTHPVGQKAPNELGLYDMSGNVWEWCSDWYGNYSSSAKTNPSGSSTGARFGLRGGGWYDDARRCRASYRRSSTSKFRYAYIGFRLAHD